MADKFFDQVEEELARASKQSVAAKGEVEHVEKPSTAQPTTGPDASSGTIAVSAAPEGADVLVDGTFVGNTPATLKLTPGKHKVTLAEQGYKEWTRDISVLPGSDVTLKATLQAQ